VKYDIIIKITIINIFISYEIIIYPQKIRNNVQNSLQGPSDLDQILSNSTHFE
jgi:hypothetical protein